MAKSGSRGSTTPCAALYVCPPAATYVIHRHPIKLMSHGKFHGFSRLATGVGAHLQESGGMLYSLELFIPFFFITSHEARPILHRQNGEWNWSTKYQDYNISQYVKLRRYRPFYSLIFLFVCSFVHVVSLFLRQRKNHGLVQDRNLRPTKRSDVFRISSEIRGTTTRREKRISKVRRCPWNETICNSKEKKRKKKEHMYKGERSGLALLTWDLWNKVSRCLSKERLDDEPVSHRSMRAKAVECSRCEGSQIREREVIV